MILFLEIVTVVISDSALEPWLWQCLSSDAAFSLFFCDLNSASSEVRSRPVPAGTRLLVHKTVYKELSSDHG